VGLGSALRGARPSWRVPSAPSFLHSSPQLERKGLHAIAAIQTNSLPLKTCPGDPAAILTMSLDKGWLVFADRTFMSALLRYLMNQSFNFIEEINPDKLFSLTNKLIQLVFKRVFGGVIRVV